MEALDGRFLAEKGEFFVDVVLILSFGALGRKRTSRCLPISLLLLTLYAFLCNTKGIQIMLNSVVFIVFVGDI